MFTKETKKKVKSVLFAIALLLMGKMSFAQNAIIHIYENPGCDYYEVEFRQESDVPGGWILMIVFPQSWEDLWGEPYSICTLTGLESGVKYEVRVREYREDLNGVGEYGAWEVFTFETPVPEEEWWRWEVGPFEVRCRVPLRSLDNPDVPGSEATLEVEKAKAIREEE